MNIPDKAIEAVLDQYGPFLNGIDPEDIDDGDLSALRDEASEILNLAAPFIAAQALREAAGGIGGQPGSGDYYVGLDSAAEALRDRADELDPQ